MSFKKLKNVLARDGESPRIKEIDSDDGWSSAEGWSSEGEWSSGEEWSSEEANDESEEYDEVVCTEIRPACGFIERVLENRLCERRIKFSEFAIEKKEKTIRMRIESGFRKCGRHACVVLAKDMDQDGKEVALRLTKINLQKHNDETRAFLKEVYCQAILGCRIAAASKNQREKNFAAMQDALYFTREDDGQQIGITVYDRFTSNAEEMFLDYCTRLVRTGQIHPNWEANFKNMMEQIQQALGILHTHGILHKDIGLANFLTNNKGKTWVLSDFGDSLIFSPCKLSESGEEEEKTLIQFDTKTDANNQRGPETKDDLARGVYSEKEGFHDLVQKITEITKNLQKKENMEIFTEKDYDEFHFDFDEVSKDFAEKMRERWPAYKKYLENADASGSEYSSSDSEG